MPGLLRMRGGGVVRDTLQQREAIHSVLSVHFVMWHDMEGPPGGEWRCQCGLKFGFSDSAIAHQAEMVAALAHPSTDPDG